MGFSSWLLHITYVRGEFNISGLGPIGPSRVTRKGVQRREREMGPAWPVLGIDIS
jgi:hypothetical protein